MSTVNLDVALGAVIARLRVHGMDARDAGSHLTCLELLGALYFSIDVLCS